MSNTIEQLEQVIREHIKLGQPSAQGWYPVVCRVCNDYKPRAAFAFSATSCSYKCFNCGQKSVVAAHHTDFSKGMAYTLSSFGVPESAIKQLKFNSFFSRPLEQETPEEIAARKSTQHPNPIELPAEFEFLSELSPTHQPIIEYVASRCVDYRKYGIMMSSTSNPNDRWFERAIVPMYNRANQVIFYQGRTYTNHRSRWESPPGVAKTNVLFGYHNLDDYSKDYVVVCEGLFDMMSIDGVAIVGSEFSPFHVKTLTASNKKKIVVPNKDSRGYSMAMQALEHGYSLSFPDIGQADDINAAVCQYGRLYTEQQILTKVATSKYAATLKLGVWCSK